MNRLSGGVAAGNSTYNQSYSYTADGSTGQYGNMTCVSGCSTPNLTFSASTNQIISANYTYDAAGELTKDSSNATAHTYQSDAEGRVSSVDNGATWGFTYNALGHRVQWTYSNGAGAYQQMFDPNGGWLGIYGALDVLRWGDVAYAWYNGTETYFNHINHLSSTTMMTNHAGAPVEDVLFYPWGQAWNTWGSGGNNFAELPYDDATTNTNLATFRLQSPGLGRWLSPDPLGGDVTNPQSLNRYGYVLNNPTSLTDPLGLWSEECSQSNDPEDCCNDPNYIGAECGGSGWPPGFWPPNGGGGGGGGSAPIPTPTPTANNGGPGIPPGMGNAGFPGQFPWPTGGTYPCDFGLCGPIWNPYTLQVGGSVNFGIWFFSFNFPGGFAIDSHGHVATYTTTGKGAGAGDSGSIGTQVAYSNADTVCGLGGPFMNASGTFGVGGTVTANVFQGPGNGPGGTVTGGGITAGGGFGISQSVTTTNTDVTPIGSAPCH